MGPRLQYARPEPTLATLRVLGLSAALPMPAPGIGPETAPEIAPVPDIPVYGPVDRAEPSDLFTRDISVRNPDTDEVDFAVRRAYDYPSGSFPAEPGRVPASVNARRAVCNNLAPRAARQCLRRGGWS